MVESHNKIVSLIKKHPAIWFFVIAFAFSWILWTVGNFLPKTSFIGLLASFGPTISAIIVAACMNSSRSHASVKKRIVTFLIVFAIAMAVVAYNVVRSGPQGISFYTIYIACSLITAYALSSVYHPIAGVAQLFSRLKQKNKRAIWLLIALMLPIAFQIVAVLIDLGLGGSAIYLFTYVTLANMIVGLPHMFIFGGPSAEEPGWRGLAAPQMQKWFNPLIVGVLIGLMWTIWHWPLYFTGDYAGGINAMLFRLVWNVPLGILFSWIYNKSNGNLLAALLIHTGNNIAVGMFGLDTQNIVFTVMIAFTVVAVFANKMWQKSDKLPTIKTSLTLSLQTARPASQKGNNT